MSLLDFGVEDAQAAAPNYVAPPKPKTSAWADVGGLVTAVPRGVVEAAAQVMGSAADLANAFRYMRDATPAQNKEIALRGVPVEQFSSDLGDSLRDRGREFRPAPETASTAEQVLYGFARGASKIVAGALAGGIPGVLAAGAEEGFTASDELRRQDVDADTRGKAGLVQGAGLALAALPAAGTTLKSTLALYAAGGPGGFMAQQALTREILQSAGYDKIGLGYDPTDPVGLAVSALIPAGFAAYGLRQAKIAQAVRDLPDLPPRADGAPAPVADALPPSELSPVAQAVKRYPQEVEDAARVLYQADVREAANPGAGMDDANKHATALARAEDQMARGEPVQVADVAPTPAVRAVDTPEFKAWFGESVVRNEDGSPMRVYHGTGREFDAFSPDMLGANTRVSDAKEGFFFSSRGEDASEYAWKDGEPGQVLPVYLDIRNPLVTDMVVTAANNREFAKVIQEAKAKGHDGVAAFLDTFGRESSVFVAFKPEQIKSAIGNSGRFDPNSPSLTDSPYATWAEQAEAAAREIRAAAEAAKPKADPSTRDVEAALRMATNLSEAVDKAAGGDATKTASLLESEAKRLRETPAANDSIAARNNMAADMLESRAGTREQFARFAEATGKSDPAEVTAAAAPARLDAIRAEYPDMMVAMDGAAPMRMDDFLAAAKAEADEMKADAPLMQLAAECALTFGL